MSELTQVFEQLLEYAGSFWIIDAHEHYPLPAEAERAGPRGIQNTVHYLHDDLRSAGMSPQEHAVLKDADSQPEAAADVLLKWLPATLNTSYAQGWLATLKGLFGLDGLQRDQLLEADRLLRQRAHRRSWYYAVFRQSKVAYALLNHSCTVPVASEPGLIGRTVGMGETIWPRDFGVMQQVGRLVGLPVRDLDSFVEAQSRMLDRWFAQPFSHVIKVAAAYVRPLSFARRTREQAERVFITYQSGHGSDFNEYPGVDAKKRLALSDYMMYQLADQAEKRHLPIQIHTGYHAGLWNDLNKADPVLLSELTRTYRQAQFVLLHSGFGFLDKAGLMARNHPNVCLDMTWCHLMGQEYCRRAIDAWYDVVPRNKLIGFGGDYDYVSGVYGHAALARQNAARAMATRVAEGRTGLDEAKQFLRWLFWDNPVRIFGLESIVGTDPCSPANVASWPADK